MKPTFHLLITLWPIGVILLILIALRISANLLDHRIKQWKWSLRFKNKGTIQELRSLTPNQFEEYIADLFRKLGYRTNVSGSPNDGGIDVIATKDGRTHYIQCKKYITRQVPVGAVRDFYGAIADKANAAGYFITTNIFTTEAERFAENKPLELIDQFRLLEYIKMATPDKIQSTKQTACPQCQGTLVERNGKFGKFYGCSNYPNCRYTTH